MTLAELCYSASASSALYTDLFRVAECRCGGGDEQICLLGCFFAYPTTLQDLEPSGQHRAAVTSVSENKSQAPTNLTAAAGISQSTPTTAHAADSKPVAVAAPYTGRFGPVYDASHSIKAQKPPQGDPGRAAPASAQFLATPTNATLKPFAVDKWNGPVGFVHLINRMSDMCYAVAAYCCDPARGAQYTLLKVPPPSADITSSTSLPPCINLTASMHLRDRLAELSVGC